MNGCAASRSRLVAWICVGLIAWCGGSCGETARAQDAPRGRLLFLGVAYDEGPPPGHDANHFNYAPDNFVTLFKQQSKELFSSIEVATVKGNGATRQRVAAAFRELQQAARPNDLVFIYWGTHGGTNRKGWSANLPAEGIMYGSEIKRELALFRCPVVCVLSTCGSGGFATDAMDGVPLPENVTAFCACRGKQSTSNELDMALTEALAGFGDNDESGQVTLREALDYVPKRYRKWFPVNDPPGVSQIPVVAHSESPALDRPLTKVTDSHAAVVQDGTWYGATILQRNEKGTKVRFLGSDSTTTNGGFSMLDAVVSDDVLDLPGGERPIEVKSEGSWYPAQILGRSKSGFRIHYIGYPDSDDETVPLARVRFPFGDPN